MTPSPRRSANRNRGITISGLIVVIALIVLSLLRNGQAPASVVDRPADQATAVGSMSDGDVADSTGNPAPSSQPGTVSNLPTIPYDDLPPEARDTIALIESGGPFPFDRDGITFENREELLPDHPGGYYREYTVITHGVSHRGARRIVTGSDGEMYYTEDHYASFQEIVP